MRALQVNELDTGGDDDDDGAKVEDAEQDFACQAFVIVFRDCLECDGCAEDAADIDERANAHPSQPFLLRFVLLERLVHIAVPLVERRDIGGLGPWVAILAVDGHLTVNALGFEPETFPCQTEADRLDGKEKQHGQEEDC